VRETAGAGRTKQEAQHGNEKIIQVNEEDPLPEK